ncbi:hypothetical protein [Phenylobacterium sp.]|jgi:hypothetical protein|uniref:hypothetical protein n=1 Tax=Phenylobacterium sp. TaxID=1871053 RepID=UPI002F413109
MRVSILFAAGALSLSAGLASAQSLADNPPKVTTMCLDVGGVSRPATCKAQASRLDAREDICICPGASQHVLVSVCPAGVNAPAESAAFARARLKLVNKGSLVGATYEGQPICRPARNALFQ